MRWRMADSVRTRLSSVIALAMLPVLVFSIASAVREYYDRQAFARHDLLASTEIVSAEAERILASAKQALIVTRAHVAVRQGIKPICSDFLNTALAGFPAFANIATIRSDGSIECSAAKMDAALNVADDEWFRDTRAEGDFTVTGPVPSRRTGESILIAAMPLDETQRNEGGVIALTILTNFLNRYFRTPFVQDDTRLFLINVDGDVIYAEEGANFLPTPADLEPLLTGRESVVAVSARDGQSFLYAAVSLGASRTVAILARPAFVTTFPILLELAADVALPITLASIVLFIIWLASERMSLRWVRHLRAVVIAHRRGMTNVRAREYEAAPIEYRELCDALNSMADAIDTRESRLREALIERDELLHEIHHRVKNNLQIIISLFSIQARRAKSDTERTILKSMQARIESLALVHHAAYQSADVRLIKMAQFVPSLLEHVESIWEDDGFGIRSNCVVDDVALTMDETVPLAQIIVEGIALCEMRRHNGAIASVDVALRMKDPHTLRLTIERRDSGPPGHLSGTSDDLSRKFLDIFARQLGGGVVSLDGNGAHVVVDIPYRSESFGTVGRTS